MGPAQAGQDQADEAGGKGHDGVTVSLKRFFTLFPDAPEEEPSSGED